MELLIFWILCGAVTAVICAAKQINSFGGFLLGLLLGPFGILIAAFLPRNEKAAEHQSINAGTHKKCSACAEMVKAEAVLCRYCSNRF